MIVLNVALFVFLIIKLNDCLINYQRVSCFHRCPSSIWPQSTMLPTIMISSLAPMYPPEATSVINFHYCILEYLPSYQVSISDYSNYLLLPLKLPRKAFGIHEIIGITTKFKVANQYSINCFCHRSIAKWLGLRWPVLFGSFYVYLAYIIHNQSFLIFSVHTMAQLGPVD